MSRIKEIVLWKNALLCGYFLGLHFQHYVSMAGDNQLYFEMDKIFGAVSVFALVPDAILGFEPNDPGIRYVRTSIRNCALMVKNGNCEHWCKHERKVNL